MKKLFPQDHLFIYDKKILSEALEENELEFTNYSHDIATYIKMNGGERIVFGRQRL